MSPNPTLTIIDGNDEDDIDFQTDLNVIQGTTLIVRDFLFARINNKITKL